MPSPVGAPDGTTSAPAWITPPSRRYDDAGSAALAPGRVTVTSSIGHGISRSTQASESAPEIRSSPTVTTTSPSTNTARPVACGARAAKPGDCSTAVDNISA